MAGEWKAVTEPGGKRFVVARWGAGNRLELHDSPATGARPGSIMLLGQSHNCAVFYDSADAVKVAARLNGGRP